MNKEKIALIGFGRAFGMLNTAIHFIILEKYILYIF